MNYISQPIENYAIWILGIFCQRFDLGHLHIKFTILASPRACFPWLRESSELYIDLEFFKLFWSINGHKFGIFHSLQALTKDLCSFKRSGDIQFTSKLLVQIFERCSWSHEGRVHVQQVLHEVALDLRLNLLYKLQFYSSGFVTLRIEG